MDCSVCCETINKSTRKAITCPYCEYVSCFTCFKTYLLDPSKNGADCMACHKELSLDFISETTPRSFHNQLYRDKRANDLLSQERSLLPDTQHLVEQRKMRTLHDKKIADLREEEAYIRQRLKEIAREINYHRYGWQNGDEFDETAEVEKTERKKFIMACPAENCRGFLSSAWKCGTCEVYVCPDCHEIKGSRTDTEHTCDKDAVATAKLISAETKNCPQCAVPIYKIDGCDQMWCVECKTPFSWRTGEKVTGIIHNPHYYQWQRERNNGVAPRVPGDNINPCGGLPWVEVVTRVYRERGIVFEKIYECHRLVEHVRFTILPRYPVDINVRDNSDLRVSYLLNDISEEQWVKQLKTRQKKSEKDRAVYQILDMFIVTMTDIFNNYVNGDCDNIGEVAERLRLYANRELQKVRKRYANTVPHITPQWSCY